jgi:hypothetical protein
MSYDDDGNYRSDVKEPLEIPRETLIGTLQTNLDKAVAEREEKNAATIASMNAFKAFLAEHADEVAGYVARGLGFRNWEESLVQVTRLFEDTDFTPVAVKQTPNENSLEKFVRVLSLASNKTISVSPDEELYRLL